jgi:hypothetical protein
MSVCLLDQPLHVTAAAQLRHDARLPALVGSITQPLRAPTGRCPKSRSILILRMEVEDLVSKIPYKPPVTPLLGHLDVVEKPVNLALHPLARHGDESLALAVASSAPDLPTMRSAPAWIPAEPQNIRLSADRDAILEAATLVHRAGTPAKLVQQLVHEASPHLSTRRRQRTTRRTRTHPDARAGTANGPRDRAAGVRQAMRVTVGRCWYCSGEDLPLTDEHVLSEANFGGRLISHDRVCSPCNGIIGKLEREIAAGAFLAERIGRDRHLFAPRDLPTPSTGGVLRDHAEVRVQFGPTGPAVISRRPRKIGEQDDGTEVWEVAAGQESIVRERRERTGTKVDIIGRDLSDAPGLNVKWGIGQGNIDHWPRFGAKVALSLASLTLEPSWLDTPGAQALQRVLAGGAYPEGIFPRGLSLGPGELDPRQEPARLLRAGEHALGLSRDAHGNLCAWMILFASLAYEIPIPDADVPDCQPTWHLCPRAPARGPMPGGELLDELRGRFRQDLDHRNPG